VREGLTILEMKNNYDDVLKPRVIEQMENIVRHYDGIEARFSKIARTRMVGKCFQFRMIFDRNMTYLLRNPRTLQALFFNISITALFLLAIFWKVGEPSPITDQTIRLMVSNMKGLSFLLTNSLMFPAIMLVVI
jgi:hypothetical protein